MADKEDFGLVRRTPGGLVPGELLTTPFGMMRRMAEEMNQLFENAGMGRFSPGQFVAPSGVSSPNVDVSETPEAVIVEAELPGVEEKDIDLQVTSDSLILRAKSHKEESRQEQTMLITERRFGSYHRVIGLPAPINPDSARARYQDGVLRVTLPKAEQVRGRRIQVETGRTEPVSSTPEEPSTSVPISDDIPA